MELLKNYYDQQMELNLVLFRIETLNEKKAIYISEKNGKTYIYKPLIDKNEFLRVEGNSFLENVYEGAVKSLILNFVKDKKLSKDDVKDLLDQIEK